MIKRRETCLVLSTTTNTDKTVQSRYAVVANEVKSAFILLLHRQRRKAVEKAIIYVAKPAS